MGTDNYFLACCREKSTGRIVTVTEIEFLADFDEEALKAREEYLKVNGEYMTPDDIYRGYASVLWYRNFEDFSDLMKDICEEYGVTKPLYKTVGMYLETVPDKAIPFIMLLLFDEPRGVMSDEERNKYYVSEIFGDPGAYAYLTRLRDFIFAAKTGKFSGTEFEEMFIDKETVKAIERAPDEYVWEFAHGYDY